MAIGKIMAIRKFFSVPGKPITTQELVELRKDDRKGFDEIAELCAKALGEELMPQKEASPI